MATAPSLTAKIGNRTKKGTLITQAIADKASADAEYIEILQDNTAEIIDEIGTAVIIALEEIGLVAEGYAKKLCPVDTGRLRNSITHAIDPDEQCAIIGTNVEYGPFVELGTSRQKAQPYLVPAASNHSSVYRAILQKHLSSK